jgi:hypothetical protein
VRHRQQLASVLFVAVTAAACTPSPHTSPSPTSAGRTQREPAGTPAPAAGSPVTATSTSSAAPALRGQRPDGPDPADPDQPASAPLEDTERAAADVAAAFALAACTVQPGDGPDSWVVTVAPYTTAEYQAALADPGATPGPPRPPATAALPAIYPLAPAATRWRFGVVVTVTTPTPREPSAMPRLVVVDVADTPAGPKVAGTG